MVYVACVILCFFEILFIFTVVQVDDDDDDDDDDDLKKYRTHHHTAPIKVGYVQFEFSQTENPATQL